MCFRSLLRENYKFVAKLNGQPFFSLTAQLYSPELPCFMRLLLRTLLVIALFAPAMPAAAYSVLTHQAVIDSTWDKTLLPLLSQRYPGATPAELDDAKSYAYGGAIITANSGRRRNRRWTS